MNCKLKCSSSCVTRVVRCKINSAKIVDRVIFPWLLSQHMISFRNVGLFIESSGIWLKIFGMVLPMEQFLRTKQMMVLREINLLSTISKHSVMRSESLDLLIRKHKIDLKMDACYFPLKVTIPHLQLVMLQQYWFQQICLN